MQLPVHAILPEVWKNKKDKEASSGENIVQGIAVMWPMATLYRLVNLTITDTGASAYRFQCILKEQPFRI